MQLFFVAVLYSVIIFQRHAIDESKRINTKSCSKLLIVCKAMASTQVLKVQHISALGKFKFSLNSNSTCSNFSGSCIIGNNNATWGNNALC